MRQLTLSVGCKAILAASVLPVQTRVGGAEQYRVVGVCLDVLLQILWSLEGFAAKVTLVRLQRYVYADVRSDVVALDCGCATRAPLAGEIQVVGALAPDVTFADVVLVVALILLSHKNKRRALIRDLRRVFRLMNSAHHSQPIGR